MENNYKIFLQEVLSNTTLINETLTNSTKYMPEEYVWGVGIAVSVGFLVLSAILTLLIIACFIGKVNKVCLQNINSALISLAIGSLLGDSVIHIIPDIYGSHKHEESTTSSNSTDSNASKNTSNSDEANPNITSLMILVGFLAFYTIEKIYVISGCEHSHGGGDDHHHSDSHSHSHSHNHEDHCHSHADHSHNPDSMHIKKQNVYGKILIIFFMQI